MSKRTTIQNDKCDWEELVALIALGVLPANESDQIRAHLRMCEKCAAEYDRQRATADLLGFLSDDPVRAIAPAAPERLKARIMRAARAAREPKSKAAPQASVGYAHIVGSDALVDFKPGVKWAVTRGDGMTLVQFVFQPPECGEIPDELHALTQSGVVLEGSFSMHYGDGKVQRLNKQDAYVISPGTVHGAEIHERTVLFDVYTPNNIEFEELYEEQLRERDRLAR